MIYYLNICKYFNVTQKLYRYLIGCLIMLTVNFANFHCYDLASTILLHIMRYMR